MKSLTVNQAKKLILKPADGSERTINEVLFFGVDKPYVLKEIADEAGITVADASVNPMYVYPDEAQLTAILQYLRKHDGYLVEQ
ncbi:hypothetical protein DYU11_29790 [Fibrisoma montanum]|uniref:Uncharacterized protein n=1 Tax=Fibrisoma montanum TaxID=2305895 RepID=A0A418LY61_9BACT|nr:hypothetical protein [Fibrisoma montanum]RIV18147.1 hypothetical protein DYU11_29790 [Fibrisoma montanum]